MHHPGCLNLSGMVPTLPVAQDPCRHFQCYRNHDTLSRPERVLLRHCQKSVLALEFVGGGGNDDGGGSVPGGALGGGGSDAEGALSCSRCWEPALALAPTAAVCDDVISRSAPPGPHEKLLTWAAAAAHPEVLSRQLAAVLLAHWYLSTTSCR